MNRIHYYTNYNKIMSNKTIINKFKFLSKPHINAINCDKISIIGLISLKLEYLIEMSYKINNFS